MVPRRITRRSHVQPGSSSGTYNTPYGPGAASGMERNKPMSFISVIVLNGSLAVP
jgi:hypothetical protein